MRFGLFGCAFAFIRLEVTFRANYLYWCKVLSAWY